MRFEREGSRLQECFYPSFAVVVRRAAAEQSENFYGSKAGLMG